MVQHAKNAPRGVTEELGNSLNNHLKSTWAIIVSKATDGKMVFSC